MNTTVNVHGVVRVEIDGPHGFPELIGEPSVYATTIKVFDKDGNETEFTIFGHKPLRVSLEQH